MHYDPVRDCFYCPMGQRMTRIGQREHTTLTGYVQTLTLYRAMRCTDCPLRGECHKGAADRVIKINHNLRRHKARVQELLTSELGLKHRSARPAEVEQAFANLKANKGFRRFLRRGLEEVSVEFGLLCISHNIAKMSFMAL